MGKKIVVNMKIQMNMYDCKYRIPDDWILMLSKSELWIML